MHAEDANLCSFNLVYCNLYPVKSKSIAKLWIIIPNREHLISCLAKQPFVQDLTTAAKSSSCAHLLDHKNIYLSRQFLIRNAIEYEIIAQYPGDVVYVRPGVFHQVLNVNPNLAEAINFVSAEWNLANCANARGCQCELGKISAIPSNRKVIISTVTKHVKVHDCPFEGCTFDTTVKSHLVTHIKLKHSAISDAKQKLTNLIKQKTA